MRGLPRPYSLGFQKCLNADNVTYYALVRFSSSLLFLPFSASSLMNQPLSLSLFYFFSLSLCLLSKKIVLPLFPFISLSSAYSLLNWSTRPVSWIRQVLRKDYLNTITIININTPQTKQCITRGDLL